MKVKSPFKKKEEINPNAINSPLQEYPQRNPKIPRSQTPNPPPPMPRNCIIEDGALGPLLEDDGYLTPEEIEILSDYGIVAPQDCDPDSMGGNPNLPKFRNPPPPPRTVMRGNKITNKIMGVKFIKLNNENDNRSYAEAGYPEPGTENLTDKQLFQELFRRFDLDASVPVNMEWQFDNGIIEGVVNISGLHPTKTNICFDEKGKCTKFEIRNYP